jgi:AcrR family transcriptional regulator
MRRICSVARPEALKPPDRRQRRSRTALRRSLLELICEQPYDSITVDQIVERADIGRATFYAHYADKADLLRELSDDMISEVAERARAHHFGQPPGAHSGAASGEIVRHAAEHPDFVRLVISGAGGSAPRDRYLAAVRGVAAEVFRDWAKRSRRRPPVPIEVTATGFAGALLATVEQWLAGAIPGTADEIAADVSRSQVEGLRWALGLPSDALAFEAPKSSRNG